MNRHSSGLLSGVRGSVSAALREICKTTAQIILLVILVQGVLSVLEGDRGPSGIDGFIERISHASLDVNGKPVIDQLLPALKLSLLIVLPAAALLGISGLALGFLFAAWPSSSVLRLPMVVLSCIPAFMFPALGVPLQGWGWAAVCLTLGDLNLAAVTGQCYDEIRRELRQPYVRTAQSLGRSIWSDAWPKCLLLTVDAIRARLPHLLGGTVAIEIAYNINGAGYLVYNSIVRTPDYNFVIWVIGFGIILVRLIGFARTAAERTVAPVQYQKPPQGRIQLSRILTRSSDSGATPWRPTDPIKSSVGRQSTSIAMQTMLQRLGRSVRAFLRATTMNQYKVAFATAVALSCILVLAVIFWGGGYSLLETDPPYELPSSRHLLGTNALGEDVLSTVALGGRQMALPLLGSVCFTVAVGSCLGITAGLWKDTWLDVALQLIFELLESIPKMVLVLVCISYIDYQYYVYKLFLVISVAFMPLIYRSLRDEVGAIRHSVFLEASVVLGIPLKRIIAVNVLRNHVLPILTQQCAVIVGYVLLFDAILGSVGIYQKGEVFTWGSMLGSGLEELSRYENLPQIETNAMIMIGPLVASTLLILGATVAADAVKSITRSTRFSQ